MREEVASHPRVYNPTDKGRPNNLSALPKRQGSTHSHSDADKQRYLVKFESDDPANPHNFNPAKKAFLLFQMSMMALSGTAGSSIMTPAQAAIEEYTHVGSEVTVLTMSLFILGFALGPCLWAPIGEVYGRKLSMVPAVYCLGILSIGTGTSKNAASIFITRFIGGVFGSAPASNASAAMGDFYSPVARGVAMSLFALVLVGGPSVGPLIGAAITSNSNMGWRWTAYIEAILAFASAVLATFCLPETYAPVVLRDKARKLRKLTGDQKWWHPQEEEKVQIDNIVTKYLSRPLRMFFTEPVVTCLAIYASFTYGLLFLTLEVFSIVFHEQRGYSLIVSTLPLLGIFVGVMVAVLINVANQPMYVKAMRRNNNKPVPEARLPPMILGSMLFTVGIFWFGWTAAPRFHWAIPTTAAGFIGAGFSVVFQQCLNFLVDTYGPYSASALATNTMLRSLLAFGLPLAARPMFINLGVDPAASVLGGVSCIAVPLPFVFMKFGPALRKRSKFVPSKD